MLAASPLRFFTSCCLVQCLLCLLVKRNGSLAFTVPAARIVSRRARSNLFRVASHDATTRRLSRHSTENEMNENVLPLMQLAQAHFSSQALYTAVKLGVPDILGDDIMTVNEIAGEMKGQPNKEALLRTLRLLVAVGVLHEGNDEDNDGITKFRLSPTGVLLQTTHESSMASFVSHWTEPAMWNAWASLPDYVAGKISASSSPFQAANNKALVDFYMDNPQSTQYRNDVARFVSSGEIPAVLDGYDWNHLQGKTVVDIGGGYGDMMSAVNQRFSGIRCICLDLPHVIADAERLEGVELIPGDMFDVLTIPSCDVIFMKHVLCDWSDEDAVKILQNCHSALLPEGKVILADALIASGNDAFDSHQIQAYIDALLMVVGSRMERSKSQLRKVANEAGFEIETITATASSPSVNITILSKV